LNYKLITNSKQLKQKMLNNF